MIYGGFSLILIYVNAHPVRVNRDTLGETSARLENTWCARSLSLYTDFIVAYYLVSCYTYLFTFGGFGYGHEFVDRLWITCGKP